MIWTILYKNLKNSKVGDSAVKTFEETVVSDIASRNVDNETPREVRETIAGPRAQLFALNLKLQITITTVIEKADYVIKKINI